MKSYFKNAQWAVTDYGLELIDDSVVGGYAIDKTRLLGKRMCVGRLVYSWPVDMAYKNWVDVNAFNDAFEQALTHHHPREVGGALLATTTRVATAIGWDRTTPKAI
jgi:hypothetical protein